jgi:hypothetical protein
MIPECFSNKRRKHHQVAPAKMRLIPGGLGFFFDAVN